MQKKTVGEAAENKEMQVPEQAGLILVPPVLRMPGQSVFSGRRPLFSVSGSARCLPWSFSAGGSARCMPGSFTAGGSISNFLYESSSFSALRAVSQAAVGLNLT